MAVLNSQGSQGGGNNTSQGTQASNTQGQEQAVAQASQSQQVGGPGQALNKGGSFLGDANGFLNQLNQLLSNPIVQKRIEQRTGNGGQGQGNQVMGQGQQQGQAPQGQQPQQPQQGQQVPQQAPAQGKEKETPREIRPQDIDTVEVFQAKLFDPEQRQELTQGLEQIGALVEDECSGMDTTLSELKEYLESDEFQEQIDQLKEAGMV